MALHVAHQRANGLSPLPALLSNARDRRLLSCLGTDNPGGPDSRQTPFREPPLEQSCENDPHLNYRPQVFKFEIPEWKETRDDEEMEQSSPNPNVQPKCYHQVPGYLGTWYTPTQPNGWHTLPFALLVQRSSSSKCTKCSYRVLCVDVER